jgi:hypothetical protein
MPAKDIYHDSVKVALIKEGWTITHDPLILSWGTRDLYVDLGAEQLLAAERQGEQIAIEIKSFIGMSAVTELERALGQYLLYHDILARLEPERTLYLAVSQAVFDDLFEEPIGKILLENKRLKVMVFDPDKEVIITWIE